LRRKDREGERERTRGEIDYSQTRGEKSTSTA
jgi:hypothetical protein